MIYKIERISILPADTDVELPDNYEIIEARHVGLQRGNSRVELTCLVPTEEN
jgi:hypothetical protein